MEEEDTEGGESNNITIRHLRLKSSQRRRVLLGELKDRAKELVSIKDFSARWLGDSWVGGDWFCTL